VRDPGRRLRSRPPVAPRTIARARTMPIALWSRRSTPTTRTGPGPPDRLCSRGRRGRRCGARLRPRRRPGRRAGRCRAADRCLDPPASAPAGIGVVRDHEVAPGKRRLDVDLGARGRLACPTDRLARQQQRLRRDARPGRALPSHELALDHRHAQPALGQSTADSGNHAEGRADRAVVDAAPWVPLINPLDIDPISSPSATTRSRTPAPESCSTGSGSADAERGGASQCRVISRRRRDGANSYPRISRDVPAPRHQRPAFARATCGRSGRDAGSRCASDRRGAARPAATSCPGERRGPPLW
jgi:hypothetical protein